MDLETAQLLLSPDGERILDEARLLEGSLLTRLTALRKRCPARVAGAALELLDLRKRATRKFSRAGRMFFTPEALEQASSETVSAHRAERFKKNACILDLACGIGGDTIGLAGRCFVTAVDRDPVRIAMAKRNVKVYGLSERVKFTCADVAEIPLDADAAFLDPSRRIGSRRTVRLDQMSPSTEFLHKLIAAIPNAAIKLSPATDYAEMESLGGEIEFISEGGECKEALIWLGDFKTASRRATVLPSRDTLILEETPEVAVGMPGRYLYEPDACVIRAHLVEHLANRIGAWKVDERIAYLSSDALVGTPFADAYEVLDSLPFNLRLVNQHLNAMGAGRVIVKKRGVPFDPREIEKKLKTKGRRELVLVLTRVSDRLHALICVPVTAGAARDSGEQ